MTSIAANLQAVRARIFAACSAAARAPESVSLLAVSKTWPASAVSEAALSQQRMFGENYVQEAVAKITTLATSGAQTLEWHFIGPLQNNKTKLVAENFAWVHSIDNLKTAQRLAQQRPAGLAALNVCIQVNVSNEATKGGVSPATTMNLAREINALPNLNLRGLMTIPAATSDLAMQRRQFSILRELKENLNRDGLTLDTLSMGMSHDLEAAILEGATIVRVGTAIFGERH
ncbi:MAG: YggS family pyridoxal phosphate-dependent enzyme [Rhodocyclaceae bacterium]|nr:YggS family pyridoxal phosphate-dependent enzyme [Rhodocyclaceae bacterium]